MAFFLGLLVFSAVFLPSEAESRPGYCLELPWGHSTPSGRRSCEACRADADCPPKKKCCSSLCGDTCQTPESNLCKLPPAVGPCKARMPKFYYNWASKRCEQFIYGGCRGNLNRFDRREQCQRACGGPRDALA
nr:eppin-like [Pogona vitticeps]